MATSTAQRVGIWIIAVVMTVGTIAGFLAMIIAPGNDAKDQAKQQEEYRKMAQELQAQNEPLDGYQASSFDASKVKELEVAYKKKGDGEKVKSTDTISANYFGWDTSGKIFDSTNKKNADPKPIDFSLDQVIQGWTKGLTGVPVGSIVELTIPADLAYGDKDTGTGQPVGPLKFIVSVESIQKDKK